MRDIDYRTCKQSCRIMGYRTDAQRPLRREVDGSDERPRSPSRSDRSREPLRSGSSGPLLVSPSATVLHGLRLIPSRMAVRHECHRRELLQLVAQVAQGPGRKSQVVRRQPRCHAQRELTPAPLHSSTTSLSAARPSPSSARSSSATSRTGRADICFFCKSTRYVAAAATLPQILPGPLLVPCAQLKHRTTYHPRCRADARQSTSPQTPSSAPTRPTSACTCSATTSTTSAT